MNDWVFAFTDFLRYEQRRSEHTIAAYKADLLVFDTFIGPEVALGNEPINKTQLKNYIFALKQDGLSERSINRKLSAIRAFHSFLAKKGKGSDGVVKSLKSLKVSKRIPHFLSKIASEEIDLQTPQKEKLQWVNQRNHLIYEILYGTGIRLSELIGLRSHDIDFAAGTMLVVGKGSKERLVPLHAGLLSQIEYFSKITHPNPSINNQFLITTERGEKAYSVLIQRVVKEKLANAKNLEKKSPHVLRHTFATQILDEGAPLQAVKELLGHASLQATEIYTHVSTERMKQAYEAAFTKRSASDLINQKGKENK